MINTGFCSNEQINLPLFMDRFPKDLLNYLFRYLSSSEICRLSEVSRDFEAFFREERNFRQLKMQVAKYVRYTKLNWVEASSSGYCKEHLYAFVKAHDKALIWTKVSKILGLSSQCPNFSQLPTVEAYKKSAEHIWSATPPGVSKVAKLQIERTWLTYIPSEIGYFCSLRELHLCRNSIVWLSSEIGMLKELSIFDLSHNKIERLPLSFRNLKKLEKLDLSFNRIRKFPQEITELKGVNLAGNPILLEHIHSLSTPYTIDFSCYNLLKLLRK